MSEKLFIQYVGPLVKVRPPVVGWEDRSVGAFEPIEVDAADGRHLVEHGGACWAFAPGTATEPAPPEAPAVNTEA